MQRNRFIKVLLLLFILFFITIKGKAEGGNLVMLIEDSPYTDQYYKYSDGEKPPYEFLKNEWRQGRRILAAKFTPIGWFALTADNSGYGSQQYSYDTKAGIIDLIKEEAANGNFVSSIAFGTMNKWGKNQWFTVLSSGKGITAQTCNFLKQSKVIKWVQSQWSEGYKLTAMSGAAMEWAVVMSQGTDIDQQALEFYDGSSEMLNGVRKMWEQGYYIQFVECNPAGKYVGVFCTYKDGRKPKQYISVCKNIEQAKKQMAAHLNNGCAITQIGGSYIATLLCNYETEEERQVATRKLFGDLSNAVNELRDNSLKESIDVGKENVSPSSRPNFSSARIEAGKIAMFCDDRWVPGVLFTYLCEYVKIQRPMGIAGNMMEFHAYPAHSFLLKLKHKGDAEWTLRNYFVPAKEVAAIADVALSISTTNSSLYINKKYCNWDLQDHDMIEIWYNDVCLAQYETPDDCLNEGTQSYAAVMRLRQGGTALPTGTIEVEPVKTGMSADYYMQQYSRWERMAESIYNSITSVKVKEVDTDKEVHGYTDWGGSSEMQMKMQLSKAQTQMRDVRNEAGRNGITIPMSHWESVTVY